MDFLFNLRQFFLSVFRIFLSPAKNNLDCVVCGKCCRLIPVCKECQEKFFAVQPIDENLCEKCGKKLISEKGKCMECRGQGVLKNLDRAFPIFSYRLWNTELLCRWKLECERSLSPFFSRILKVRLEQILAMFGKVSFVPVPPRPGKIKKEGWDQIEELSLFLEHRYGFSMDRILGRKSSVQQKTLDRDGRLKTIGSAYFVKDGFSPVPERICVIDDVMTTGATLEGIAGVLKEKGAKEVFAVTLFTVDS